MKNKKTIKKCKCPTSQITIYNGHNQDCVLAEAHCTLCKQWHLVSHWPHLSRVKDPPIHSEKECPGCLYKGMHYLPHEAFSPKKTIKKKWKEKKAIWNDITKPTKTVRTDKKIFEKKCKDCREDDNGQCYFHRFNMRPYPNKVDKEIALFDVAKSKKEFTHFCGDCYNDDEIKRKINLLIEAVHKLR